MIPLDHADYGSNLRPHSPTRCQAMERRLLNERDPLRRRLAMVQCGLKRHIESVPHEHSNRKFGTPAAKKKPKDRNRDRCEETEERLDANAHTKIVRCSRKKNHLPDSWHKHGALEFGRVNKARIDEGGYVRAA